jgi:competence protein ComEA
MKPLAALAFLGMTAAVPALATVNVNTAQQSELQATRGLDKAQAKSIIEYRNGHGPYRSLDDLAKVLGEPTTEKVASQVAFDGPPYIGPPKPAKNKKKETKKS